MPRRGRHRTQLPFRLLAAVAALLVGGTAVVLGGTALAKGSDGGSFISSLAGKSSSDGDSSGGKSSGDKGGGAGKDSSGKDSSGKDSSGKDSSDGGKQSGSDSKDGSSDGSGDKGSSDSSGDGGNKAQQNQDKGQNDNGQKDNGQKDKGQKDKGQDDKNQKNDEKVQFPGRDKIAPASGDDFVDINNVAPNGNIGEGGEFADGSASVNCGVSDHNNSDNFIAAPGKRNGAQHVHDYVGNTSANANSSDGSLNAADTSCANGDKSTFYWPVLRDLNGQGPDVGQDGGSKDGNVGSILKPTAVQISFHGHGDEPVKR